MSRGRLSNHLYMVGPRPLDPTAPRTHRPAIAAPRSPPRRRSRHQQGAEPCAQPPRRPLAAHVDHRRPVRRAAPGGRCPGRGHPEDRSHDVESLTRTRDALHEDLHVLKRRRHDLVEGHRTRRERRRGADPELALVDASQPTSSSDWREWRTISAAARTSTRASEAFFEEHAPVVRRLDRDRRHPQRPHRPRCLPGHDDRPAYLTRTIGPLPAHGEPVGGWIDAATLIETHRLEHGILDGSSVLGTEPLDPAAQLLWRQVLREVQEVMSSSGAVREISEVQHDLDLDL